MKTRINSAKLSNELRVILERKNIKQRVVAEAVGATQGEIANLLKGRFKTINGLVLRVCKYVRINPDNYRLDLKKRGLKVPREAIEALAYVCRGNRVREKNVVRILRALGNIGAS